MVDASVVAASVVDADASVVDASVVDADASVVADLNPSSLNIAAFPLPYSPILYFGWSIIVYLAADFVLISRFPPALAYVAVSPVPAS